MMRHMLCRFNILCLILGLVVGLVATSVVFARSGATITGRVTAKYNGYPISGATVYFSKTPNASANPTHTATTDALGLYTRSVENDTWYVSASAPDYYGSDDKKVVLSGVDVTAVNLALNSSIRDIPRTADLIFSCVTDTLPWSGATGPWATYLPGGQSLSALGSPSVEVLNGIQWENNLYADGDGYQFGGSYTNPIPINGATIVVVVQPVLNDHPAPWNSIVDVFFDRLVLAASG